MAALTAADWTIAITEQHIHQKERVCRGTAVLAGVNTYPTAGIPMPTKDKFGMKINLDSLELFGNDGSPTTQFLTMFDKTNNKMQLFGDAAAAANQPLAEAGVAIVPGPRTYRFEARGW